MAHTDKANQLIIKNMVCPRCISAVQQILQSNNIAYLDVGLGRVQLNGSISDGQKSVLARELESVGFELLDDKQSQLVNKIKSLIIEEIHFKEQVSELNFSDLLSQALHYEYSHLSRLFSSVEGKTIEQFILAQKIEKVKELLTYDELILSEIADRMHYSSAAYLSNLFKRHTGMTPSQFRKLQDEDARSSLDAI